MQIGAILPQMEFPADAGAIRRWTGGVEALGFGHVLLYEHVLGADPFGREPWPGLTHEASFHEPMTLMAFMAGISSRLSFLTGVIVAPQRQTALLAKQAAEVDILCGGRLRLGVGVGWNRVEYEGLGMEFGTRGRRCDEQIGLLRRLWTEPVVDHAGAFERIDRAGINPLPIQRPIPIWVGGDSPAAMSRAARLGDGWLPHGRPDGIGPHIGRMREELEREGRDPAAFGIECRFSLKDVPEREWPRELEGWRRVAGVTHLGIDTLGMGLRSPEEHVATLERFSRAAGMS